METRLTIPPRSSMVSSLAAAITRSDWATRYSCSAVSSWSHMVTMVVSSSEASIDSRTESTRAVKIGSRREFLIRITGGRSIAAAASPNSPRSSPVPGTLPAAKPNIMSVCCRSILKGRCR